MPDGDAAARYAPKPPQAVQKQIDRANDIQRGVAQPTTTTVVDPVAAPPGGATPPTHATPAEQNFLAPAQPPAPAPASVAPPGPDFKAQYESLRGKYDRETVELRAQINAMNTTIQQLLQRQTPPAAPAPTPAPAENKFDLTKDREEYGELVDKAQAWAEAKYGPVIAELQKQIKQLGGQTQAVTQATAQERVHSALDAWQARTGKNWRVQNDDDRFINWLNQTDPFSGQQRLVMMRTAYANGDSNRVVNFFDAFAKEMAATGQQPNQDMNNPGAPAPAVAHVSLETLAAPGRGASGNPPPPGAKRIWTPQDVTAFYSQRQRGYYRGREQEAAAIEQDLFAAQADGRYRQK
jgi:hypothetical protein